MVGATILCLTLGLVLGEVFDFRRVIALIGQAILAVVRVIAMVIGLFYHYISFWFRGGEAETSEHQQFDDGDVPVGYSFRRTDTGAGALCRIDLSGTVYRV